MNYCLFSYWRIYFYSLQIFFLADMTWNWGKWSSSGVSICFVSPWCLRLGNTSQQQVPSALIPTIMCFFKKVACQGSKFAGWRHGHQSAGGFWFMVIPIHFTTLPNTIPTQHDPHTMAIIPQCCGDACFVLLGKCSLARVLWWKRALKPRC